MTTPASPVPLPNPLSSAAKKKRVLLVDTSGAKRDLRADVMRKLGIEVDCAADISEARAWWRADLYNLVLMNVQHDQHRDKFCDDVRRANPPQQLAFLVGKPGYLANSPETSGSFSKNDTGEVMLGAVRTALAPGPDLGLKQRWGILEACRRISAVRSVSDARSRAIRDRPAPPRDPEGPRSKRNGETRSLDELLKEEMQ